MPGARQSTSVCATLVALNGLYMLLVAFGNITDHRLRGEPGVRPGRHGDGHHQLRCPAGTGLDPDVIWHAITNPALQTAAYLGVIAWESGRGSSSPWRSCCGSRAATTPDGS